MKRLALLLTLLVTPVAWAGDEAGVKQTVAYLQKLQTSTGGFLSMEPKPNIRLAPTLRATSAGTRALHYLGAEVPNRDAAAKYVESCFDAKTGGFGDMPGGKPDVFTTSVGVMAVVALKMPKDKFGPPALKYLEENAKGFEEIRIVAAALESLEAKSSRAADWLKEIETDHNGDGSYGKKDRGQARVTGGASVAVLRLHGKEEAKPVVSFLKASQRPDGAFGKEQTDASDLETTYRVMRAFHMHKALPRDVKGLKDFVAKCRNADGGYGVAPGEPSGVGPTYYAAIIRHWLKEK